MNDGAMPPWGERLPRLAVIGAGSWGTALAALLAKKHGEILLWCREPEVADGIRQNHRNPHYLAELPLPASIRPVTDLSEAVADRDLLVMAVPVQFTRGVLQQVCRETGAATWFVSVSKGIEAASGKLLTEVYREEMGSLRVDEGMAVLSGPSFAREVLQGLPTAVVVAAGDPRVAATVQALFHTSHFRTYRSEDRIGVELSGAIKNVIAIAAGIGDGLGFGYNARAALITRGLAEIARLGCRMGARPETFSGLSGLGDLLLTATSDLSRNRTVGQRIGWGEDPAAVIRDGREVAEGVLTAPAVLALARALAVEMPITQAVCAVLQEGMDPRAVVSALMERELKAE